MLEKVTATNGVASRRAIAIHRQLILPVAVLGVIAAGVLAALMLFNARVLDDRAQQASISAIHEGISERAGQLDRVVKDYAWWNEAVEAVQLRQDQLGRGALGLPISMARTNMTGRSWSRRTARPSTRRSRAKRSRRTSRPRSATSTGGSWSRRAAPPCSMASRSAMHAFLPMRDGGLGIASAGASRRRPSWPGPPPGGQALRAVRRPQPDGGWLQELASALDLEGFQARPLRPTSSRRGCTDRARRLAGRQPVVAGATAGNGVSRGAGAIAGLGPAPVGGLRLVGACARAGPRRSAIVESEARFRDVADASSDWIFETDADGRLTWISERFIALTGIPSARSRAGRSPTCCCRWPARSSRPSSTRPCRSSGCSAACRAAISTWRAGRAPCAYPASRPATRAGAMSAGAARPPTSRWRSRPARPRSS